MQSICQAILPDKDLYSNINLAMESGPQAIYLRISEVY